MSLIVDLTLERPGFKLRAAFASGGGVTALFGRSGAGKSTLALLIAGLVRPTAGRVVLDDIVLTDTAARIFVPPHRRRIAVIFQDGRLFPHLTVRQNLLYGAWFNRADRTRLSPIVELLGIETLLDRRPATLSGGEQRRVAIGRAVLAAPRLLVLDEPLTGLDDSRKNEILPYLEALRDELGVRMVYISHAIDEVVRLADTLVLLDQGQVTASGPTGSVIAQLDRADAGAVIAATVEAIDVTHHIAQLGFAGGTLRVPAGVLRPGDRLRLHLRARDIAIATEAPRGVSILNALPATVVSLIASGDGAVDVTLDCGGTTLLARITTLSAETLGLTPGVAVHALIKSVALS